MSLFKHQFMKFSRSEFKLLVSSRIEESENDRVASSANRSNTQNYNVNGKSFTYRRNSKGPRTDPCMTPAFSAIGVDNFPEMWTCYG